MTIEAFMWARIDRTRCQGHARCAAVGRDFYKVDANGFVANEDSPIPPELEAQAIRGARACPERAITVELGCGAAARK